MSGECEKCGEHSLNCFCVERLKLPLRNLVEDEEKLEPDFTWKVYLTHMNTDEIFFEGAISISDLKNILETLEKFGCDHVYCKNPIVFT